MSEPARHDPYRALREPGYGRYLFGNLLGTFGLQMQAVAVGWELYERTHSALALGLTGLVGNFESGALAALAGPVVSVVAGGVGTLITVAAVAAKWPEVRKLGRITAAPL